MPLILDTHDTNARIAHIMEDARKFIVIICPYLKITDKLRRTIEIADGKGVKTFLLYGKRELDDTTYRWLRGLENSNIGLIPELHAKLYMNEDLAVMTSMNLYEYSQVNNEELGVLFGRKEDKTDYKELSYQAIRMFELSKKEHGTWDTSDIEKPLKGLRERLAKSTQETTRKSAEPAEPDMYCIRCGDVIHRSEGFVYCSRCMESWGKYTNFRYTEKDGHCVICGKTYNSSAERPACLDCYTENREFVRGLCEEMRTRLGRRVRPTLKQSALSLFLRIRQAR